MTATLIQSDRKSRVQEWASWAALAALFIGFAIQLCSPLRLNTDAVAILKLTQEITDHKPYLQDGMRPVFPIGMPLTYSIMERAGIANPVGFAALNFACLCVALYCSWNICLGLGLRKAAPIILLTSFGNWVLIKHEVLPLTDIPFLAASLVCVALMENLPSQRGQKRILTIVLSIASLAAAMLIRRVGVALVPALGHALWPSQAQRNSIKAFLFARKVRVIGLACFIAAALGGVAWVFRKALYLPDWKFNGSPASAAALQLTMRLTDFGELFCNIPTSQLRGLHVIIRPAGLVLAILILIGLWRVRHRLHPAHVYLLAYLAILAIWPYGDARFWLPVLPLLAIVIVQAIEPLSRPAVKLPGGAYLAVYALMVIIALGYSTRLTFAGRRFPSLYGSGSYRQSYEDAWMGKTTDPTDTVAPLIRRYGMVSAPKY